MQVTSNPAPAAATTTASNGTSPVLPQATLGQDDFLKLLAVQMQSQDPMKPMDDTAFISQMTSFTSLQQMKSLTDSFGQFQTDQRAVSAQAYLGKQVTVNDSDLGPITGAVSAIGFQGDTVSLTVNGKEYALDAVTKLTAATAAP